MPFLPPSRRAVTPGGRGRFAGFDVLSELDRWDDVTAGVILARLDPQPDYSFFTPAEQATADALFDRLLAQDKEPKVPVLQLVDQRLALDMTDGWFYEDMPEDTDAWRVTLAALDDDARHKHGAPFHALPWGDQAVLLQGIADAEAWHGLKAGHVWSLWTRYACAAFYSHPWAWNEIGFGGPAYPRGYKNIGVDARERWETPDRVDHDPVGWAERAEQARRSRQALTPSPDDSETDQSQGTLLG
ncbi:MAG: gluconate 2-dehydrogenase subunit 3 family protein [Acidimicrobiales bacterium]|nr:gluconate 2-dehydrogenase subunit 3 family protein [Acidimicrobiales bacterium]